MNECVQKVRPHPPPPPESMRMIHWTLRTQRAHSNEMRGLPTRLGVPRSEGDHIMKPSFGARSPSPKEWHFLGTSYDLWLLLLRLTSSF